MPEDLAALQEQFADFCIWQETIDEQVRYVACGTGLAVRPHTVITTDLAELRAALHAGTGLAAAGVPARPAV
jgi:hypothetical protein